MIVVASGLVLGEGVMSIITALMRTGGIPILSCIGCEGGLCGGGCK